MTRCIAKCYIPMLLKKLNLLVVGIGQTILQGGSIQLYPLPIHYVTAAINGSKYYDCKVG